MAHCLHRVALATGNVLLHWQPEPRCGLQALQMPGRLKQLLALVLLGDKGIIPAKWSHGDSVHLS